ncbi:MAG: hypothetical protein JNM71_15710 [Flavobacterium lindanitolerans]|uniref:hypothetical protein n=1 Tax=Flavobacterium lindanitolerans TaxID=428988 RepID=UPI001A5333DF|nr:hypothetical protein [Flavobacterium lindanitolerans]MBL7869462.1 hypothetical protein [Flavobacterium lindanitolerans]
MKGYKPPKTSRITIQPAFYGIWNRTWKNGSIVAIAPYFSHEKFTSLDKFAKYRYVLDLIQTATTQLSDEYHWNRDVFENAYNKTLASNFNFRIEYPSKQSKDRIKSGVFVIEKTETVTSAYAEIHINDNITTKKLFDKKNAWWYDCVYFLARHNKWFDNNKFGIEIRKGKVDIWYSLNNNVVELYEDGQQVTDIDFGKYFLFN